MSVAYLTVEEVRDRFARKIGDQTVRDMIARGDLQAIRVGRRVLIVEASLDAYLARQRKDGDTVPPARTRRKREQPPADTDFMDYYRQTMDRVKAKRTR